ncbi:thioredoxin domain-containing protein [Bifidobacterium sp. ESL0790]|uniref:DsbA family protein n=1 Tax=Bifidobacterium sp. ESL0790 TaxID=2983233 RepID=UPI0023F697A5|nr:thioredoxin domain-containing protein [Bifidobacterium sp. ESL0790]WEV71934.1 thioredoxin domain-containing protein [Bifidobacterium sp. ESL0790]
MGTTKDSRQTNDTYDSADMTDAATNTVPNAPTDSAANAQTETVTASKPTSGNRIKVIFGAVAAVLVVVIVIAAGFAYWNKQHGLERSYSQLQSVTEKPAHSTKQGGVPTFPASAYNPKAPDVDLYVDFLCPNCADLDKQISPTLRKLQAAKQINLYIHPVTFLDAKSKHHYSIRSASAFAYVAAHEPGKALDFVTQLYDKGFQPNNDNKKDITDQQIVDQAIKAGVRRDVAEHSTDGTYKDFVEKASKYTVLRKELFVDIRGDHRFSTPTICINGTMWQYRRLHSLQDVTPTLIQSLGLEEDQVGDKTVMPSIGHHSKALPIQKKFL